MDVVFLNTSVKTQLLNMILLFCYMIQVKYMQILQLNYDIKIVYVYQGLNLSLAHPVFGITLNREAYNTFNMWLE